MQTNKTSLARDSGFGKLENWLYWNVWMRFPEGSQARQLGESAVEKWLTRFPHRIAASVPEWCAQHGVSCREILPERPFTRRPPHTLEATPLEYFSRPNPPHIPKYLAVLQNARLTGMNGIVILPDGTYTWDANFSPGLLAQDPVFRKVNAARVTKKGNYFSLINSLSRGWRFYHWLHDGVMRLYAVQELLPPDTRYLVPPQLKPWQLESLQAFGITKEQLVPFDGTETWELESLYMSNWTTLSALDDVNADRWFADALRKYAGASNSKPTRRLYISRGNAPRRRLLNEPEVLEILQAHGFEAVSPEKMTLAEQVRLFSQAEMVAGPHGSGFTNIYYAPPGMKLLDFVAADMYNFAKVFWTVCETVGHEYWYLLADSVERPNSQADIHVSPDKLRATLQAMLV